MLIPVLLSILPAPLSADRPKKSKEVVIAECMSAIEKDDGEKIEGLRDYVTKEHIAPLVAKWKPSLPWAQKDLFLALLMDYHEDIMNPMAEDGLNSPDANSRLYSLLILKKDLKAHKNFLTPKGWVDPAKVDAAIKKFRAERKKK